MLYQFLLYFNWFDLTYFIWFIVFILLIFFYFILFYFILFYFILFYLVTLYSNNLKEILLIGRLTYILLLKPKLFVQSLKFCFKNIASLITSILPFLLICHLWSLSTYITFYFEYVNFLSYIFLLFDSILWGESCWRCTS